MATYLNHCRNEGIIRVVIGETIRKLRIERDLTQETLAGNAGISPTTLGNIETGRTRNPDRDTVDSLAKALEVPIETLIEAGPDMGRGIGAAMLPESVKPITTDDEELQRLREALGILLIKSVRGEVSRDEVDRVAEVVANLARAK